MSNLIQDFIHRSRSRYTADQIKQALADNLSIITEDGFICFNIVQDECYILFFFVRPGVDTKPYLSAVEFHAKANGCKVMCFITNRAKAFSRLYKDYHIAGTLFEKNL